LEVTGFIEGRHMKEKFSSLTFTHETWNDINTRRKEEHPDKKIVGWFHTHPGHGIFLSRYDLFIHQNFFPGKDQIAVVFDPLRTRYGFFVWEADQVKESQNVFIFVYNNEKFDQEIQNLPYIGNIDQHTDSEHKPHIDVDVDIPEVIEEEQGHKPFEKMFETAYQKFDESNPVSPEIVPISPVENGINSQSVVPDESRLDTARQDSSPIIPGVKIEYSGETNLSQSPSVFDAIREKRDQKCHEITQEIDRPETTRDKPEKGKPDKP
jgi:proteasome lid subunit RPN8/RPN11